MSLNVFFSKNLHHYHLQINWTILRYFISDQYRCFIELFEKSFLSFLTTSLFFHAMARILTSLMIGLIEYDCPEE